MNKKKAVSFITAMIMACASALLSGCTETKPEGANYSFDYALTGNPESLDPQFATDINSRIVIGNLFTGLMKIDDKGELKKAIAQDYTISDDGLKYQFTLREDCVWFYDIDSDEEFDDNETTPVTAHDFEFAFKRIFDPQTRSPHRETYECLKNASSIINGGTDYNEIGVKALSDTELIFELDHPSAGFLNLLTLTSAMPCNEKFFYDSKGRYGLDEKSIASNGAFFVRQWFYDPYGHDNFIYMNRNLKNSNFDRIYPTNLNFYIKETKAEAAESFSEGVSDVLMSFKYDPEDYEGNECKSYFNYTYGIIINPKKQEYANKSIRKALAYGIDKEAFNEELPDDMKAAYGIIPPDISFLKKKYREINADKASALSALDGELIEYDPKKATEFFESGMAQMGLKSLPNIKILLPEDYMDTEYLHFVTQNWLTLFGFYIGIEEVPMEEYTERLIDEDYTMAIYPLSGDYNNPLSVLQKFEVKNNEFGYSNSELESIIEEIKTVENYNDSVEMYSRAENIILNDFMFIPVFYKKEFQILGSGNHDIFYDPFTKQLNFRYAKYYE